MQNLIKWTKMSAKRRRNVLKDWPTKANILNLKCIPQIDITFFIGLPRWLWALNICLANINIKSHFCNQMHARTEDTKKKVWPDRKKKWNTKMNYMYYLDLKHAIDYIKSRHSVCASDLFRARCCVFLCPVFFSVFFCRCAKC